MSQETEGNSPEPANAKKLRACSNCARLKIRCRWPPGSEHGDLTDCTRCSRMGIRCRVPEPAPRKKRGKSSRVTELERKIDGLVNLFQSQQHQPSQQQQTQGLTPVTNDSTKEDSQLRNMLGGCTGLSVPNSNQPSTAGTSPNVVSPEAAREPNALPTPDAGPSPDTLQLLPGFAVTLQQAGQYLNVYRTRVVPSFPFVPIDASVTARELHTQKRFLFWCIMQALVPHSPQVQVLVDEWVRKYAAAHIVVARERKLELLQGLVVHVACHAWGDIHIHHGISATGLLQLSIGLVLDMSTSLSGPLGWLPKTMLADAWAIISRGKPYEPPQPSLEEQRAILGGYFVASCVAASVRRAAQVQYGPHLARCVKNIRKADALSSDTNLLALIRIQQVSDRLGVVLPTHDREYDDEPVPIFREHYSMILAALRKDIDNLPSEEPGITKDQPLMWVHYQTLLVRLYEPAIGMRAATLTETHSPTEPYSRAEALWSCLQSIQAAMDALLAIPAETYAYLPFVLVSDTAFSMMAANRLLLDEDASDWDAPLARSKMNHPENVRLIAEKFEEADSVALIVGQKRRMFEDNTSRWSNYAYRARWMRQWYLSKVAPVSRESEEGQAAAAGPESGGAMSNDPNISWTADFAMDHAFWEPMMLDGFGQIPMELGGQAMPGMMQSTEAEMARF